MKGARESKIGLIEGTHCSLAFNECPQTSTARNQFHRRPKMSSFEAWRGRKTHCHRKHWIRMAKTRTWGSWEVEVRGPAIQRRLGSCRPDWWKNSISCGREAGHGLHKVFAPQKGLSWSSSHPSWTSKQASRIRAHCTCHEFLVWKGNELSKTSNFGTKWFFDCFAAKSGLSGGCHQKSPA